MRYETVARNFGLYGYKILNLCFIISLEEFVSENGSSEKKDLNDILLENALYYKGE